MKNELKNDRLEGIILNKTPLKGRNLIAQLLLRNGQKISIIFYGGVGGGKKSKGGIIELGQLIEVIIKEKKNKQNELFEAKEWNLSWFSSNIRKNHHAFYLMCFILEISALVAIQFTELENNEDNGLFGLVSNHLFYIDKSFEENGTGDNQNTTNVFDKNFFLMIFFSRLYQQMGVFPELELCHFCGSDKITYFSVLDFENGGFCCQDCINADNVNLVDDSEIIKILNYTRNKFSLLFDDLKSNVYLKITNERTIKTLLNFFLYQFRLEQDKIRSVAFLFTK